MTRSRGKLTLFVQNTREEHPLGGGASALGAAGPQLGASRRTVWSGDACSTRAGRAGQVQGRVPDLRDSRTGAPFRPAQLRLRAKARFAHRRKGDPDQNLTSRSRWVGAGFFGSIWVCSIPGVYAAEWKRRRERLRCSRPGGGAGHDRRPRRAYSGAARSSS